MYFKTRFLSLLLLPIAIPVSGQQLNSFTNDSGPPPSIPGYTLVWKDEFNTDGKPAKSNWIYENGFVR
ncbi:MAG: hypothetical protein WKI04_13435, partial [Ferruginibacter sp.]